MILLGCKFTFSYFLQVYNQFYKYNIVCIGFKVVRTLFFEASVLQIKPLMDATPAITSYSGDIKYAWHDFVSKSMWLLPHFVRASIFNVDAHQEYKRNIFNGKRHIFRVYACFLLN